MKKYCCDCCEKELLLSKRIFMFLFKGKVYA